MGHKMEVNMESGDVVVLRSASKSCKSDFISDIICVAPKMTIEATYTDGTADCIWWTGTEYKRDKFKTCTLSVMYKNNEFSK